MKRIFNIFSLAMILALMVTAMGKPATPAFAAGPLVGQWNFEGDVNDSSANGYHGSLAGSPSPSYSSDVPTGGGSNSMQFNGGTGYVNATLGSEISGNHTFTVTFWMKYTPNATKRQWALLLGNSATNQGLHWLINTDGTASFGLFNGAQNSFDLTPYANQWAQVTTIYNSSAGRFTTFVNGDLKDSTTGATPNIPTSTPVKMGFASYYPADAYYTGLLDGFQVYDCVFQTSVHNTNDSGADSLRQAIADVCEGGTVTFASELAGQTIALSSELVINKNLTIDGSALASQITISGDTNGDNTGDVRVFHVTGGIISLNNLTISNGYTTGGACAGCGGGLIIENGATVNVDNSTFANNKADHGGAIENWNGILTVRNSTFTNNTAVVGGGAGINTLSPSTAVIANSTFTNNTSPNGFGGAIYNASILTLVNDTLSSNGASSGGGVYNTGTFNASNTIIANSSQGGDCVGSISTNVKNLVEDGSCSAALSGDPTLDPAGLANNGGPTQTIALQPSSPALGAGDAVTCTAAPVNNLDQRGQARPQGDATCDIGAYESSTLSTHTVTFNGNGNTGGSMSPQAASGSNALTTNGFTRTGYTFTGWDTAALGGGTAYANGGIYNFTADITLFAQWTLTSHTVTFNGNGNDGGSMSNQTASSLTALTLNSFTRSGYTFTGWNDAPDGSGSNSFANGDDYSFANDITLYAQWTLDAVAPSAVTTAPSGLTSTDVILHGTVNANGDDATVTFEIGLDNTYGLSFPADEGTVTGSSDTPVSVALTGLTTGTTYHYRVAATNAGGTTYGDDLAFTAAPSVTNWVHCANESGTCSFTGTKWVRYGDAVTGAYAYGQFTGSVACGTAAFGYDPIVNTVKTCDVENNDVTPPDTSIVTKPISYTTTVNATFAFTGSDNISATGNLTFFCKLDSLAYRDCGTAYLWTNLSIGQHTFRVYAVDEAGNADPTPAVYSWWVQAERTKNGSFNTYVGASKVPQFWTKGGTWSTTDGKATDFKKEGAAALKFVGQTGKTKTITQTMTFSGTTGNYLRFSFWAKGATIPAAGVCKVELMLYNGATLTQTKVINCKPNTYNYVKQQLNFYASSNFTKVVVKMTYSKASGTIWFDLMSLLK